MNGGVRHALAAAAVCLAAAAPAAARPHVVIFVADDLGWSDVGYHGEEVIETPSLDRLAREGVQLDRFYTTPICSPTRAALMTGRDPMRLGVAYAVIMAWQNNGVHPAERFMPEAFRDAGYQTAMVGKWHLGHAQMSYHPNQRGFEHFYGHLHTEVGYFPPFANQGGRDFQRNGESIEAEGYETFLLAEEASRVIRERDPDRPLFLYARPLSELQDEPAPGMPPPYARRSLDWMHGEGGRLIYDCEPYGFLGGGLCK